MPAHNRLKKVITAKGQTMWYLGDGIWFGRTSKSEAELGLATGKYFMWETVDHRPQVETQNESVVEAVEEIAEVTQAVETQIEQTDEEVIDVVLEATGLKTENDDEAVVKYGHLVNVNIARQWIGASNEADKALAEYRAASNQVQEVRAQMRPIRERLIKEGVLKPGSRNTHPDLAPLEQLELELIAVRDAKNAAYDKVSDRAWDLSKKIISEEPKQPKQKVEKDYQKLVEYWDRKLDGVIYRLNRAKGALETAQKKYERVSNAGKQIIEYFPLGMVGGSGRGVKALNKKKGQELDRLIDAVKSLEVAKVRVSRLQDTFDRYQKHYENACQKAAQAGQAS